MANTEKHFYSKEELQEFDTLINEKLTEARRDYQSIINELKELNDNPSDTADFADRGSSGSAKEQLEYLMTRHRKFIINLEHALSRIQNGTYGVCKVTGKLIQKERLRIVPHTTTSVEGKNMTSKR